MLIKTRRESLMSKFFYCLLRRAYNKRKMSAGFLLFNYYRELEKMV